MPGLDTVAEVPGHDAVTYARVDTRSWIILILVVVVACKSEKKIAYERVAGQINPILTTLRPKVAAIMQPDDGDPTRALVRIEACESTSLELNKLRSINFDADELDPDPRSPPLHFWAEYAADARNAACRDYQLRPNQASLCSKWCLETFEFFTNEVERLHNAAKAEGVHIVSLKP